MILDLVEDDIEEEVTESIQSGTYDMRHNQINWSLDLSSNSITVKIINRPNLGTKIINENNPVIEYRSNDRFTIPRFYAKIIANFDLKHLLLDGHVKYSCGRIGRQSCTKKYENIILTSW